MMDSSGEKKGVEDSTVTDHATDGIKTMSQAVQQGTKKIEGESMASVIARAIRKNSGKDTTDGDTTNNKKQPEIPAPEDTSSLTR